MTGTDDAGQLFEMRLWRLASRARIVRSVLGVAMSPCQEKRCVIHAATPPPPLAFLLARDRRRNGIRGGRDKE